MRVACSGLMLILLLLLTVHCAHVNPGTPVSEPPEAPMKPGTPPPAAEPEARATPQPAAEPAPTPQADPKSAAPATPQPAPAPVPAPSARPPAPRTASKANPPVAKTPGLAPAPLVTPAPTVAPAPAPAPKPAAAPAVDLNTLTTQLKQTKAIGLMTKLTLKNQVDDLLDQFRVHYQGKPKPTLGELRRTYDLLMMKVLSLVQDEEPKLASNIVSSREAIWGLLADPKKFATFQG